MVRQRKEDKKINLRIVVNHRGSALTVVGGLIFFCSLSVLIAFQTLSQIQTFGRKHSLKFRELVVLRLADTIARSGTLLTDSILNPINEGLRACVVDDSAVGGENLTCHAGSFRPLTVSLRTENGGFRDLTSSAAGNIFFSEKGMLCSRVKEYWPAYSPVTVDTSESSCDAKNFQMLAEYMAECPLG